MKIKDLCSYAPKSKIKAGEAIDDAKYIFFTSSADENKRYVDFQFDCEAVIMGTGGNATLHYYKGKFSVSTDCLVLLPGAQIKCKYLYYFFKSHMNVLEAGFKGAGLKHTNKKYIEEIEINEIPDLITQEKIIYRLDVVMKNIEKLNNELVLLDSLVKARFIEMFGDPFDTTKWTVKELKDLSDSMVDGSNVNPDYYQPEGEVLFLRIQNVWRNELRLDDSVYITQEINKTQYYDTSLRTGDLLITKIGRYYTKDSSLGRISVYRGKDDCANYSNNIMRVRLNRSVNSEFVNVLLNLDEYQSFIKRTSKGGTDKRALSKSLIGNYPIILPPEELQKRFASIVQQIDKSKFYVMYKLNCIKI